jgi:hypothetical protein
MKTNCLLAAAATALLTLTVAGNSRAGTVTGTVACDANNDNIIDSGDIGIPQVLVIVTNETGSFSNSDLTAADGSFKIHIPNFSALGERQDPLSQVYIETLDQTTLPTGSTIVFPQPITNLTWTPSYFIDYASNRTTLEYTSGTGSSTNGDWLINNPECQSSGGGSNSLGACSVSGSGITTNGNRPDHLFKGTVSSDMLSGRWTDIQRGTHLRFDSTSIDTVTCGTGSIDFTGTGTLRGKAVHGHVESVQFAARLVQTSQVVNPTGRHPHQVSTPAAYYLRVFDANGDTLDLVSGDPGNPEDVAPVPVTDSTLVFGSD